MERLGEAKQAALKYVTARMRTRQEVKQLLQKKGYEPELVPEVLDFLQHYQYVDDAAYCRSWVRDRVQFHPCGRQKMAYDLAQKVPDRHLVAEALEECYSREEETRQAILAAEKKLATQRGITAEKLSRFLYSRGYSADIIRHTLESESIQGSFSGEETHNIF